MSLLVAHSARSTTFVETKTMPLSRWRLAAVVVLFVSLVGGFAPQAVAAQDGNASLTIHSRFCPPGYEGNQVFEECHGDIGMLAVEFTLQGQGYQTGFPDTDGNIAFSGLLGGTYQLSNSLPADLQRPYVYCSSTDGVSGQQISTILNDQQGYVATIQVDPGENIICDWYTIPYTDLNATRANITIHNRWCPVGYDGSDEFADCHDNIGISYVNFTLNGHGELIQDGNIVFSWLEPGVYTIDDDIGLDAHVVCSTIGSEGTPFLEEWVVKDDNLSFSIDPGDDVVCDWYTYPTDAFYRGGSTLPVAAIACQTDPGGIGSGRGELPEDCHGVGGVKITVYPTLAGTDYAESCVTSGRGGCNVVVPFRIPLTAEIDESTLPNGWYPKRNPTTGVQYTEFAGFYFLLLPDPKGD
jgi:hypothetical protein